MNLILWVKRDPVGNQQYWNGDLYVLYCGWNGIEMLLSSKTEMEIPPKVNSCMKPCLVYCHTQALDVEISSNGHEYSK